jgi:penicillin-binding protein 1A
MGIKAPLEANLSLALGSSVVSPLDQAAGYATLANQGIHIDPAAIRLVTDSLGTPVLDNRFPQENEVISAGTAYLMTSMLESVIQEGTGTNAQIGRPAAGKTGTTSDFRDAWFVGYTPDLVTAVWLGNDDYSRMNESYGGNIPARTWARFMEAALKDVPKHDFAYPASEVRKVAYCGGFKKYEYFLDGTEPTGTCASPGYNGHSRTVFDAPPVVAEPVALAVPAKTAPPVKATPTQLLPATAPPPTPIPEETRVPTAEIAAEPTPSPDVSPSP